MGMSSLVHVRFARATPSVSPRHAENAMYASASAKTSGSARRHRQDKRHAGKRHECWKGRERKLYLELCAKHLPGLDGQRLRKPEGLSLERDRRRRHVVHRRNGAHAGAEQYLHAAAAIAEGHLQKQQELPALNQQRHARDWQQQDAKPAVEHVVRARGEARELLAEKCPIDAPALDGLFAVHSLARCADAVVICKKLRESSVHVSANSARMTAALSSIAVTSPVPVRPKT